MFSSFFSFGGTYIQSSFLMQSVGSRKSRKCNCSIATNSESHAHGSLLNLWTGNHAVKTWNRKYGFDELETALMEMVKQDNRRQLCARILMRFEQDQKETEDACRFAEQNAVAQRYSVEVLQVE